MAPTTALPLHLTCETVVIAASGLLLAWSALRRRRFAAGAALALFIVQCLHAGQFIERDDDPVLIALRFAGIIGLAGAVLPMSIDRALFGGGLFALAVGTLWAGLTGGTAADLAVGPHVISVAGATVLLFWVWRATRPSVRLRVLAAFVAVLAVTVVVAGGAVARVAAVNSRDEQFARLSADAAAMRRDVIDARDELRRRVAGLSPLLSTALADRRIELDPTRFLPGEWTVIFDREGARIADAKTDEATIPYTAAELRTLGVVRQALTGRVVSATDATTRGVAITAAAPVFRRGGTTESRDVIGAALLGRTRTPQELRAFAAGGRTEVAIFDEAPGGDGGAPDGSVTATTHRDLLIAPMVSAPNAVALETIEAGGAHWLVAVTPLPDGNARVVVAAPAHLIVDAANDLVRAFLLAILAAALLAVIAALWLSARVSRPMLDLADEAERVKAEFLANVSHELRTPLTPIRGYTEILRRGRIPARDASGYLDEIGQAAQRLERVVALLLDVASIEAGRFWIDTGEVDAREMLDQAQVRWRDRSREHRIQVDAADPLPNVLADPDAIARVLDELLDNAIKFSPSGCIDLGARAADAGVVFSVRDDGPGIDTERLESLREAFRQAESGDTRRFGGLGLGLTFAEGVLAAHGSSLDIDSAPGEGTTCSFTLAAAGSVTRMASQRSVARTSRAVRSGSRKR